MTWTKKHDEFCTKCRLRPSTRLLLHWLRPRAKFNEICQIEIDLKRFNSWIAKYRGKPFERKTIREAIAQLNQLTLGAIVIMKSYTPWVHKILVRPISFIDWEKSQSWGKTPKLATGNPMYSEEHKKRARELLLQNISKMDKLLRSVN